MPDIQFLGRGINLNAQTKEYISEKLQKHSYILDKATQINVIVSDVAKSEGSKKTIKVEINTSMPHAFIKVEDRGSEIKAIVDKLEVILKRRLTRYEGQFKRWEKEIPWKVKGLEEITDRELGNPLENYTNYEPIIKRKEYDDDSPKHPAEAIERMEMLGHNSFLFRNINSGKYAMLYKRENGGYGLVEPKS